MDDLADKTHLLRSSILADPASVLDDPELMQALADANGNALGSNVVDVRGIALSRLESRLARLEDTHRSVIAAAYENLSGTNQIHRAILRFMDARDFPGFLRILTNDIGPILQVDSVRLVLETAYEDESSEALSKLAEVLRVVPKGFVRSYLGRDGATAHRAVTLRQIHPEPLESVFGRDAERVTSEAAILLDLGPGRLPGLLILASDDPHKFKSTQGTDLLGFFGGVFERTMWRWLD